MPQACKITKRKKKKKKNMQHTVNIQDETNYLDCPKARHFLLCHHHSQFNQHRLLRIFYFTIAETTFKIWEKNKLKNSIKMKIGKKIHFFFFFTSILLQLIEFSWHNWKYDKSMRRVSNNRIWSKALLFTVFCKQHNQLPNNQTNNSFNY